MVQTTDDGATDTFEAFDRRYLSVGQKFGANRAALKTIPLIDISAFLGPHGEDEKKSSAAEALRQACIDVGFFYLNGHGISADELHSAIEWGHRFFDLPLEKKMKFHTQGLGQPGFMRIGGINPDQNPDKAPDMKERFIMGRELFPGEPADKLHVAGMTRWPSESVLPGFTSFMKGHLAKRVLLAQALARAFSTSLKMPEGYFDRHFEHLGVLSIINYYPPLDAAAVERNQWSFSPHTDYGAFTILSQDSLGGLQVRNSTGDWIDVPPIEGTFVVNIGNLMATWTNDLYQSNLHRAANVSGKARISIPFFVSPHADSLIECLDTCRSATNPPRYEAVTAGDYVRALREQADRTGRPGISASTASRLKAEA